MSDWREVGLGKNSGPDEEGSDAGGDIHRREERRDRRIRNWFVTGVGSSKTGQGGARRRIELDGSSPAVRELGDDEIEKIRMGDRDQRFARGNFFEGDGDEG